MSYACSPTRAGSSLGQALASWSRFWFESVHTHSLCLLRLFFGFVMTLRAVKVYGLYRIDDMKPALPRYEYDLTEMYGAFSMPWRWFEWIPAPTLWWYNRIDEALLVLLILFTVGLFTRFVGPLIAAIYAYVFLSTQLNYYHHVWCYTLILGVLAFSRCGDRYSLDSYFRGPRAVRPKRTVLPLRLIQVLLTLLYTFTFISKLNPGYLTGRIMFLFHEAGSIEGPFYAPVLDVLGYQGLSWATLLSEGLVPFAIWWPRLRMPAIGVGVMLHLGIDMMMSQRTFSYQMMTLYIAFITPAAGASVALFNGRCPACFRSRRWVRLFDWLDRTTWLDSANPAVADQIPPPARAALEQGVVVVSPEGRLLTGFEAWRHLILRLPITFIPGLILCIPGPSHLAGFVFRRSLGNRHGKVHGGTPLAGGRTEEESPWMSSFANLRARFAPTEASAR